MPCGERPARSDPTSAPSSRPTTARSSWREWHGYGRAYPPGRRQIVGAMFHLADREPYQRLNDVVCVTIGEVRAPSDLGQAEPELVVDVAELIWEPIADRQPRRAAADGVVVRAG